MADNKNENKAASTTKVVDTDTTKKDSEQKKVNEQHKQEELRKQQEEQKKQEELQKQQAQQKQSVQQQPSNNLPQGNYNFKSCKEAKSAGFSNITRDHPAYSSKLDRDGDGLACDK
ncbi:excalibur calcium-binding domain-containing protein [Bacillus toyonensis]|uniref:excalibur calcium-binding domain-containing protein n=1 Tax=Bacillus toyonensis TaxID=155322 RepID=UPI001F5B2224|nr:excalibur calcium-binding domain-containing protein [Bacillus toyonensis]